MSTTTSEIDDYVTAVHAALADLPDDEREDLLDDLPQHLADVRADRGGSLVDLIGTPEAYASELRATAGLDATPTTHPWQALRKRSKRLDELLGSMLGYARFVDLLRALAPAWWLLRAYLIVEVCTAATQRSGTDLLVPEIGGNRVAGAILLALALIASVWLGRRGLRQNWQRAVVVMIGLALAVYGVALVRQATAPIQTYVGTIDNVDGNDTADVTKVYPVGPDGTVLHGIRLYDQDGNPITLGLDCPANAYDPNSDDLNDPAATTAPTYPQTCPGDQGPFPSGRTSPLPAAPSPSASSPVASAPATAAASRSASSTPSPSR